MMASRFPARTAALAVLLAAMAVTGCSSSDDDDGPSNGTPSSETGGGNGSASTDGSSPDGNPMSPVPTEDSGSAPSAGEGAADTATPDETADPGSAAEESTGAASSDASLGAKLERFGEVMTSRTNAALVALNEQYSSGTLADDIASCIPEESREFPVLRYGCDNFGQGPLLTSLGAPISVFLYDDGRDAEACRTSLFEGRGAEGCEVGTTVFVGVSGLFASWQPASASDGDLSRASLSDNAESFYRNINQEPSGENCRVEIDDDGVLYSVDTGNRIDDAIRADCDRLVDRFLEGLGS